MNRATYWLCIGVLLIILAIINFVSVRPLRINEALLVILCVPRLHDLGKSGWWVVVPLATELAIIVIFAVAALSLDAGASVAGLAIAVFVVVLGLIPGQPHANRFGEPLKSMFSFRERRKIAKTEEIFK